MVVLYQRHWRNRKTSVVQNCLLFLNVSICFLIHIKQRHRYSCFSCRQIVTGQCNLSLNCPIYRGRSFTHFHHGRCKSYRAKIIQGRNHRSFWYRHNSCGLPSSWYSICGETLTKYNAKTVSKLFSACLEYSWCDVIRTSCFVGIHMLKRTSNFILTCMKPLKVIIRSRRLI